MISEPPVPDDVMCIHQAHHCRSGSSGRPLQAPLCTDRCARLERDRPTDFLVANCERRGRFLCPRHVMATRTAICR
jgi:hypothetical protein